MVGNWGVSSGNANPYISGKHACSWGRSTSGPNFRESEFTTQHPDSTIVIEKNRTEYAKDSKKESQEEMSFGIIVLSNRFCIVAADTRSTLMHGTSALYYDNYQKIAAVPNTNIVAMSTGVNSFDGQTFTDIVNSCSAKNLEEAADEIFGKVSEFVIKVNGNFFLHLCEVRDGHIMFGHKEIKDGKVSGLTTVNTSTYRKSVAYAHGPAWATKLITLIDIPHEEAFAVESVTQVMDTFKAVSQNIGPLFGDTKTIGGNTQMVVLSVDKGVWRV